MIIQYLRLSLTLEGVDPIGQVWITWAVKRPRSYRITRFILASINY